MVLVKNDWLLKFVDLLRVFERDENKNNVNGFIKIVLDGEDYYIFNCYSFYCKVRVYIVFKNVEFYKLYCYN